MKGYLSIAAILSLTLCACTSAPVEDGFYLILRTGVSADDVGPLGEGERLAVNDYRYVAGAEGTPPQWLVVPKAPSVPLVLDDTPVGAPDEEGRLLLQMRLDEAHIPTLEAFTRDHLNDGVAIIIDGDVVTTHKIRATISDGRVMITRCADDACRALLTKLGG